MKRIIRLTENSIIRLIKNIVKEVSGEFDEGLDISGTYLEKVGSINKKDNRENRFSIGTIVDGIIFSKEKNDKYKVNFSKKFIEKYLVDIEDIDSLTEHIYISTQGEPTNRIHFSGGIPERLKGYGLGYLIYRSFIKYLGWASSDWTATDDAKRVWTKIRNDLNFYSSFFKISGNENILSISREKSEDDILKIIKNFMDYFSGQIDVLKLDEDLVNNYPNLVSKINEEKDEHSNITKLLPQMGIILRDLENFTFYWDKKDLDIKEKNDYLKEIENMKNVFSQKESSRFSWMMHNHNSINYRIEMLELEIKKNRHQPNFIEVANKAIEMCKILLSKYNEFLKNK
jgi:hypothetical protein